MNIAARNNTCLLEQRKKNAQLHNHVLKKMTNFYEKWLPKASSVASYELLDHIVLVQDSVS